MYNSNVNMGAGSRERTILDFAIKQFFVSKLYSMLNNYNCKRLNVAISRTYKMVYRAVAIFKSEKTKFMQPRMIKIINGTDTYWVQ